MSEFRTDRIPGCTRDREEHLDGKKERNLINSTNLKADGHIYIYNEFIYLHNSNTPNISRTYKIIWKYKI